MDRDLKSDARAFTLASLLFLFGPLAPGSAAGKSTKAGHVLAGELCKDKQGSCNIVWTDDPKVPVVSVDNCPGDHRMVVTNLPRKGDAVCVKTPNADGGAVGIFEPTRDSWIPYKSVTSAECLTLFHCSMAGKNKTTKRHLDTFLSIPKPIAGDGTVLSNKPGTGDFQCKGDLVRDEGCHAELMKNESSVIERFLRKEFNLRNSERRKKFAADKRALALAFKNAPEGTSYADTRAKIEALTLAYKEDQAKGKAAFQDRLDKLNSGEFKGSYQAKIDALAQEFASKTAALEKEFKDKKSALTSGVEYNSLPPHKQKALLKKQTAALLKEYKPKMNILSRDYTAARLKLRDDQFGKNL